MELCWIRGEFAVCRLAPDHIPKIRLDREFVFLQKTDQELSIVCRSEESPSGAEAMEAGWHMFRIEGTLDFSLIGVLASVTRVLERAGISVFVLSTYDTDYVMVKSEKAAVAEADLRADGWSWKNTWTEA